VDPICDQASEALVFPLAFKDQTSNDCSLCVSVWVAGGSQLCLIGSQLSPPVDPTDPFRKRLPRRVIVEGSVEEQAAITAAIKPNMKCSPSGCHSAKTASSDAIPTPSSRCRASRHCGFVLVLISAVFVIAKSTRSSFGRHLIIDLHQEGQDVL
jgi:hypothetical protein